MRRALLLLAFAVACSQETAQMTQATPPQQNAPEAQVTMPRQDAPDLPPGPPATADQPIQLIEYAIRMPQTLKAGKQSLHVENAGKELHSLEIEGNGIHTSLPSTLSRGSRGQMDVDLKPGTYTFYCPVEGHREKGMELKVTVQ